MSKIICVSSSETWVGYTSFCVPHTSFRIALIEKLSKTVEIHNFILNYIALGLTMMFKHLLSLSFPPLLSYPCSSPSCFQNIMCKLCIGLHVWTLCAFLLSSFCDLYFVKLGRILMVQVYCGFLALLLQFFFPCRNTLKKVYVGGFDFML